MEGEGGLGLGLGEGGLIIEINLCNLCCRYFKWVWVGLTTLETETEIFCFVSI